MEYVITDHNDPERKFIVEYNGYTITVDYPMDIDTFENLSGILDIILPGILASYIEPVVAQMVDRALSITASNKDVIFASMDAKNLSIGTSDNDIAGTFWNY